MSTLPKVKSTETEMISPINHTKMSAKKLTENIFSNTKQPIINDPIDPTRISRGPLNNLNVSSVVKAGLVFFAMIGGYYLAKTTYIFSYFGCLVKEKIPNLKNVDNDQIMKIKNRENDLIVKTNLKTIVQVNDQYVNQMKQIYKTEDDAVEFEEMEVENLSKINTVKQRFSDRRSINVQNPIPDQNVFINRPFNLTINGNSIFNSNSSVFLETPNIPNWLTTYCNPSFKGSYNMSGETFGVAVSDNYAYMANEDGLYIIGIGDPSNPTFKGSYNMSDASEITLSGNYAYVTTFLGNLEIIDITNSSNPTFKGSYNMTDEAYEVVLSDDYAYVADNLSGLQIIDITDPSNPTFKGSYFMSDTARGIAISDNYAYLADSREGLQIIDISNSSNPTFKGSYNTPGFANGVALSGNYAYVADWESGLQIVDISNPSNPTFKGSYDMPGYAYEIALSGNYAYVADNESGLQIVDISDPSNPTFKGSYNILDVVGVAVSGNYAYVADWESGLQIIAHNLDKLTLSGKPNSIGTYKINIKACNEEKECATDSFDIIVSMDLTTILIIIGSITGAICIAGFCCLLIGGGGIIILKRYRNRNKILESAMLINDSQIVGNNYFTMSNKEKESKFFTLT
jgi:hypothetical protein